jgi:hypothetical protein
MIRYESGREVEFVCPHCGENEIIEITNEIIECGVVVWGVEDNQPIDYDEDDRGFPLREIKDILQTQYLCGGCFQEVEVYDPSEDEESLE